jgi:hypothetical protein
LRRTPCFENGVIGAAAPHEENMAVQPLRKDEKARNPQTVDEARAFVKYVESLFTPD